MVIISNSTKKVNKDISWDWVNLEVLKNIFAFVYEDVFDQVVTDVGPVDNLGLFPLDEDKRMYSQYEGCIIHFHE